MLLLGSSNVNLPRPSGARWDGPCTIPGNDDGEHQHDDGLAIRNSPKPRGHERMLRKATPRNLEPTQAAFRGGLPASAASAPGGRTAALPAARTASTARWRARARHHGRRLNRRAGSLRRLSGPIWTSPRIIGSSGCGATSASGGCPVLQRALSSQRTWARRVGRKEARSGCMSGMVMPRQRIAPTHLRLARSRIPACQEHAGCHHGYPADQ